jgi:virginiamycin B lyase
VWYTAQNIGELGWLDPATGETRHTDLGSGSSPHGVIVDAEGTAWVTDSGLNAIVAVDPSGLEVTTYPLPDDRAGANLNTATIDGDGTLWFTGQSGIYGRLDPETGEIAVFDAPGGRGPYGIATTPTGDVFYASLAGSFVGEVGSDDSTTVLEPPTPGQGARRVWSDSSGRIWVSEWNSGNLSRYSPETETWDTWHLPGDSPQAYAVYVSESDIVWASDFGSNSIVRFDPTTEKVHLYPLPHNPGNVRQILGRMGEVWFPESAADHLLLIRETRS